MYARQGRGSDLPHSRFRSCAAAVLDVGTFGCNCTLTRYARCVRRQFWCMPQRDPANPAAERTADEQREFDLMLGSIADLYLTARVLIILDTTYVTRFWVRARLEDVALTPRRPALQRGGCPRAASPTRPAARLLNVASHAPCKRAPNGIFSSHRSCGWLVGGLLPKHRTPLLRCSLLDSRLRSRSR